MEDKSALLNQLRLDRGAEPKPARRGRIWLGAGSILDASGYVVARRQATVASKITAKMVEPKRCARLDS